MGSGRGTGRGGMRVLIESRIRGEPIHVMWEEGIVTGDLELVDRARRMYRSRSQLIDECDVTAFISALDQAAGERLEVTIWAESEVSEQNRPLGSTSGSGGSTSDVENLDRDELLGM